MADRNSTGQFVKGKKPGPGRPKGSVSKANKLLKDAILLAGERAGNKVGSDGMVSYLEHQAAENPTAFLGLIGKVLPLQVTGEDGVPIEVTFTIGGHDATN